MSGAVRVCAEVGQNHQGSIEVAKDCIYRAAHPVDTETWAEVPWRADIVKLTARDLAYEMTRGAASAAYAGQNSFGPTYMDHRRRLELPFEAYGELCEYAHGLGLEFAITLCSPTLVKGLTWRPDYLKVASRDLDNGPLLVALAETGIRIVLSTGMASPAELRTAVDLIEGAGGNLHAILQCTSSYPCKFEHANLLTIPWLKQNYPDHIVGFSDHTEGVQAGAWAVLLGAEWVEVHVTPSRAMRGSDHRGALSIGSGLWRYIRNIRNAERAKGEEGLFVEPSCNPAARKLRRSIAATSDLSVGTLVGSSNTVLLSPGTGVPWTARGALYGKRLAEPVGAHELILPEMVSASS